MSEVSEADQRYMRRAIELAEKGRGRTSPNPMVGAVIVKEGAVVGEGYHEKAGQAHAEINALKAAGRRAEGAVMYVSLEPCPTQGRTPPCTDALGEARVAAVVIGMIDPNPAVSGRGVSELERAGIEVRSGALADEVRRQNEAYVKYVKTARPFVVLKVAMTLDGKVATKSGQSRWISDEDARTVVHGLRDEYDAVAVGVGTVVADNPRLDVRLDRADARQPLRVVIDSGGRIPHGSWLVRSAGEVPTMVATTSRMPMKTIEALSKHQVEVVVLPEKQGGVDLEELLSELGRREMSSLLVEGGPRLTTAFLTERLADKCLFFIAPKIIGETGISFYGLAGESELSKAVSFSFGRVARVGRDIMVEAYV